MTDQAIPADDYDDYDDYDDQGNYQPGPYRTLRDQWCCDPWENPQDHEGETE